MRVLRDARGDRPEPRVSGRRLRRPHDPADVFFAVLVALDYVIIVGRPFAAWAAFGCAFEDEHTSVCLSAAFSSRKSRDRGFYLSGRGGPMTTHAPRYLKTIPIRFLLLHMTRHECLVWSGRTTRVKSSGIPTGLTTSRFAPVLDKFRIVQSMAPPRWNEIVPPLRVRLRGALRFSFM